MSEAKFTKGPWVADIRSGCCSVYAASEDTDSWGNGLHDSDSRNIYFSNDGANYNGHHWEMSPEAEANANLIAAAPEMYQILDEISQHMQLGAAQGDGYGRYLKEIKSLLAKARGES